MTEEKPQDQQRNWLIKSSTRILGPFTFIEVVEQLRSKQISIIDEIRQPQGRWAYVRENPRFLEVVKTIRNEQDSSSEQTMTQSIAQHTSITRTDITHLTDELTPTPTPSHFNQDLTPPPISEAVLRDIVPTKETMNVQGGRAKTVEKSYGSSSDTRVMGKIRRRSHVLTLAIAAIGILVVATVFMTVSRKGQEKTLGYDEMVARALRYKSLGLYEKSLGMYHSAIKIREPDFETQVKMANLLISEDRQSLVGRRVLERALIQEGRSRAEVVEAYLGIAVSYMMDGDLKQAEDTLQKAIGHEPFNISALLNLAIIQLKKGNYGSAMRDFDAIYRKNPQSVLALFGRSVASVEYAKENGDTLVLSNLVRDIRTNLHKTAYLRQELILFLIYAQSLLGDVDGVNQSVVQFLSQMPGQSGNFVHPLEVDWRFTQWDYVEKYCSEVYNKQTPHPELKALRAICYMEVKRDAEAQKLLSEALAEAPKDPYVLITQAAYLTRVGRFPEAQVILKAPEVQSLPLKNLLLGEMCVSVDDVNCAHAYFSQAFAQDSRNANALLGLAWVVLKGNERTTAYDYIRAGLQSEPNFLPLIELRDQVENE